MYIKAIGLGVPPRPWIKRSFDRKIPTHNRARSRSQRGGEDIFLLLLLSNQVILSHQVTLFFFIFYYYLFELIQPM